jgi:hypothetical protein
MTKLKLTLACGNYDRTRALIEGSIQPEGIELNFLPLGPGEIFWRMLNNQEFDVSEMSLSTYSILRSQGDERFIALPIESGQSLERMLEAGEIDALASVVMPRALFADKPVVRRLFPNYREVETDYYRRTHIFPIMHTLVLKRELFEREPWVAISLYKAFVQAKEINYKHLYDTNTLAVSLPWLVDEIESSRRIFGPEIWDYSIEGSRPTLEALVQYLDEQGLSRRRMKIEELFAPNISPEFVRYLRGTGEA